MAWVYYLFYLVLFAFVFTFSNTFRFVDIVFFTSTFV